MHTHTSHERRLTDYERGQIDGYRAGLAYSRYALSGLMVAFAERAQAQAQAGESSPVWGYAVDAISTIIGALGSEASRHG